MTERSPPHLEGRDVVEETGCCDRRAIDALAELPEHEREGWQRGNRLGCASCASLRGAIPASCRRRDRFAVSRPERLPAPPGLRSGARASERRSLQRAPIGLPPFG